MARVNVYLPDDLAAEAKAAGLNVSNLSQAALRSALAAGRVDQWLDGVVSMPPLQMAEAVITAAVAGAKDDVEGRG